MKKLIQATILSCLPLAVLANTDSLQKESKKTLDHPSVLVEKVELKMPEKMLGTPALFKLDRKQGLQNIKEQMKSNGGGVVDLGGGHSVDGILFDEVLYGHLSNFDPTELEGFNEYTKSILNKIEKKVPRLAKDLRAELEKNEWIMSEVRLSNNTCPQPEAQFKTEDYSGDLQLVACQNSKEETVMISGPDFLRRNDEFQGKIILHELIRSLAHKNDVNRENIYKLFNKINNIDFIKADKLIKNLSSLGFGNYLPGFNYGEDLLQGTWNYMSEGKVHESKLMAFNNGNLHMFYSEVGKLKCDSYSIQSFEYITIYNRKIDQLTFCNDQKKDGSKPEVGLVGISKHRNGDVNYIALGNVQDESEFTTTAIELGVETDFFEIHKGEKIVVGSVIVNRDEATLKAADLGESQSAPCVNLGAKKITSAGNTNFEAIYACDISAADPDDGLMFGLVKTDKGLVMKWIGNYQALNPEVLKFRKI